MNDSLDKDQIKAYLLGRISDEEVLQRIEDRLFADEAFVEEVRLAEEEIIDDYVLESLAPDEKSDAEQYFFVTEQRKAGLKLARQLRKKAKQQKLAGTEHKTERPGLADSLIGLFRRPAFAGMAVVLIAAAIGTYFLLTRKPVDELAGVKDLYKTQRPVEPRLSGFDYAPQIITRGNDRNSQETNKLRQIELDLLKSANEQPSARNSHALGVFYLTERKFTQAITELEKAKKLAEKDPRVANDLGTAYFELAKDSRDDKRLENLARALEEFSRASELDPGSLEILFNRSLGLQELNLPRQARESWNKYLEKDPNSKWADEARRYLEKLEAAQSVFKTPEQVLGDFLGAYRSGDHEFAFKINCQTKEMISGVWLPGQLTRRYLEARRSGDTAAATESIEALKFIGKLEKERHADFFVADLADYYGRIDDSKIKPLLKAKDYQVVGYKAVQEIDFKMAIANFGLAKEIFSKTKNVFEKKLADLWIAMCLTREGRVNDSINLLNALELDFVYEKFEWLFSQALYWKSQSSNLKSRLGERLDWIRKSLKVSESISDQYGSERSRISATDAYNMLGEPLKSWGSISRNFHHKDRYFRSAIQEFRNCFAAASALDKLKLFRTAVLFGRETLSLANEVLKNSDAVNYSHVLLSEIYQHKDDVSNALEQAELSTSLAEGKEKSPGQQSILADSILRTSNLQLEANDAPGALSGFDKALDIYKDQPEVTIQNYEAKRGRLLALKNLNRETEFELELRSVLELSSEYRRRITEDESRQAFFDKEQAVFDLASLDSLNKGQIEEAFAYTENSRARSLLELISSSRNLNPKEKFPEPLSLSDIQERMPEQSQILQYALLDGRIAVWVIDKQSFKIHVQETDISELEERISELLEKVRSEANTDYRKEAAELYDLLISPVKAFLDPDKEICIVPDKALNRLPYALLTSEKDNFLTEEFPLVYSPSSSIFVLNSEAYKKRSGYDENLLAVGNPAFDKGENEGLEQLPEAETEVNGISKRYAKSRLFFGEQATKQAFLREIGTATLIHFAGHSISNPESPANSKLLFAGIGLDGELRGSEILAHKMPDAKLAVLSACQTGYEKYFNGEGAVGIARTFLAAGVPSVVSSFWKVDSFASSELMELFHSNRRKRNLSEAKALREAQIELIHSPDRRFNHPRFWAAIFVDRGIDRKLVTI